MKHRYITISGRDIFWGKNEITRETLGMVKDGRYDVLIDTQTGQFFNADENKWEDIKGD